MPACASRNGASREIAREYPDVPIIFNHTGMQVGGPDHFDGWRPRHEGLVAGAERRLQDFGTEHGGLDLDDEEHPSQSFGRDNGACFGWKDLQRWQWFTGLPTEPVSKLFPAFRGRCIAYSASNLCEHTPCRRGHRSLTWFYSLKF